MRKLKILIASRSRGAAVAAERMLETNPRCQVETRVISNGHVDPLQGLSSNPDLLLLYDHLAQGELQTLSEAAPEDRPALVVFGPGTDPQSIRLAMRAGARDYLTTPLVKEELFELVDALVDELSNATRNATENLHVFINGKGGSGASFLATNVAHGLAVSGRTVTLVDLDLQFSGLCRYLDLTPKQDILDAVSNVSEMDDVSAMAFTAEHESGLRLLSAMPDTLCLNHEVSSEKLTALLELYQSINDFVIVDLPRHIDYLAAAVLEKADQITVVMQQSFPHLHDTARLLHILRREIGVDDSRLSVVVNRYSKDSAILLKDIETALKVENLVKIPNHYRLTAESVNSGIPLSEVNRKASVTRSLQVLHERMTGAQDTGAEKTRIGLQGLFRR